MARFSVKWVFQMLWLFDSPFKHVIFIYPFLGLKFIVLYYFKLFFSSLCFDAWIEVGQNTVSTMLTCSYMLTFSHAWMLIYLDALMFTCIDVPIFTCWMFTFSHTWMFTCSYTYLLTCSHVKMLSCSHVKMLHVHMLGCSYA